MGVKYKPVIWTKQIIIYDVILFVCLALYIYLFVFISQQIDPDVDIKGVNIRAYGSAAIILLHVILSIGPLARLNTKFLPLLFNRRHLGVTMFLLAANHARLAIYWYHKLGDTDPYISVLISNLNFFDFIRFPFEILGLLALIILFVMAATSHDFWLANLTAPVWKAIHMFVYLAYGLLVGHVVLGAMQAHTNPLLTVIMGLGMFWIVGLHVISGFQEFKKDQNLLFPDSEDFVEVGTIDEIPEYRAKVVAIAGERVAVFKYDGKISAISNACQHQNGPLGEGKIIDGCITCPWHGYQYAPESGASPPPFTEKVPNFDVKLVGDRIFVKASPNRPGTYVEPAIISSK